MKFAFHKSQNKYLRFHVSQKQEARSYEMSKTLHYPHFVKQSASIKLTRVLQTL